LRSQWLRKEMAPQVGLEPTTLRLTAGCSAIELLRSVGEGARSAALRLSRFIITSCGRGGKHRLWSGENAGGGGEGAVFEAAGFQAGIVLLGHQRFLGGEVVGAVTDQLRSG
jgi:hypothetical protein